MNDQGKHLQHATRAKLRKFNTLRGEEVQPGDFWDLVIVTAVDESQRVAYELQIKDKIARKELPLGVEYKVFSDPPGAKIGNGGSTLYVLQRLDSIYGKALGKFRVILIHAGGFSQRLPNASALGKIFTALPLCEPLYQMLELKLAMYVDFPSQMRPGVLVTCADDIEMYSISEDESVRFDKPGFTALAHPSSLSIGTTHGVFVLGSDDKHARKEMEYVSCLQFLHKPSIAKMQDTGAVCKKRGDSISLTDDQFVYTDSTYYVCYTTALLLLSLLKDITPLRCEVDAYGDFLQALGPEATDAYTRDGANVHKREESLVAVRQKIFRRLSGTPLNVILLNNSKFCHVGSTAEFLFHLTQDPALRAELGLVASAFSARPGADGPPESAAAAAVSCVMHSTLEPSCSVARKTVLEYCRLEARVTVGTGSILSGCWVDQGLCVPAEVFMHSLCVTADPHQPAARPGFVTVCFGIHDDLKRSVPSPAHVEELTFLGLSLTKCLSHWGMGEEALKFSGDCSLWNVCLFPVCSDLQSSFSMTLDLLQAVLKGSTFSVPSTTQLVSMHQALQLKNLEEMLTFRKELYNDIKQKRSIQ
ncbi:unnamed protein product [Boreogadus saida]